MSTITTRSGKGSPLTHNEVDANFTNLNTDKYQSGDDVTFGSFTSTGIDDNATSTAITIDSSQRVGIGTAVTNTDRPLHLHTPSSSAAFQQFTNTTTGTAGGDGFLVGINSTEQALIYNQENTDMVFATNDTERMRIDSSGNVGIGTSSPSYKADIAGTLNAQGLQVKGSPSLSFNASNWMTQQETGVARTYICGPDASTYQPWEIYRATSTGGASLTMKLDASGNVGIGTTSPAGKLSIAGGTANDYSDGITLQKSGGNVYGIYPSTNNLEFRSITGNTHIATFAYSGNVGIGTTSPITPLDVFGKQRIYLNNTNVGNASSLQLTQDGTGDAAISFLIGATTEWLAGVDNSDSDKFKISNITGGGDFTATGMTIDSSGNVGIGSSSTDGRLKVSAASGASNAGGIALYGNNGGGFGGSNVARSKIESATDGTAFGANMLFYTNDTSNAYQERMRIDSNGNVGIGESSPATYGKLVIKNDTASGVGSSAASCIWLLNTNTTANNASSIFFGDNGISAAGAINFINTDHTSEYGAISFDTRGSSGYAERMRIDSSGNVIIGDTSATFNNTAKTVIRATDNYYIKPSVCASFNRTGTDGDILRFHKASSIVGSIGVSNSEIYLSSGNTGLYFDDVNNHIRPTNASGAARDNTIDLGSSSNRFKDLYLSGGAYLGGTGAANYLDDYEEGTFTPTLQDVNGNAVPSYYWRTGTYTKIGKVVHISIAISPASTSGVSGSLYITGLPFVAHTTSPDYQQAMPLLSLNSATKEYMMAYLGPNSTQVSVMGINGNGFTHVTGNSIGAGSQQIITGTYLTN